jgi:hypothetical protein
VRRLTLTPSPRTSSCVSAIAPERLRLFVRAIQACASQLAIQTLSTISAPTQATGRRSIGSLVDPGLRLGPSLAVDRRHAEVHVGRAPARRGQSGRLTRIATTPNRPVSVPQNTPEVSCTPPKPLTMLKNR